MVLLDNDAFLTNLSRMLEKSRGKGTVQITMKRCAPAARPSTSERRPLSRVRARADAGKEGKMGGEVDPADCKCSIRAIGNKKGRR